MKKAVLPVLLALTLAACGSTNVSDAQRPPSRQLDREAPTVTLSPSARNLSSPGQLTLNATARDDVAVKEVRFYLGDRLIATDTTAPYTATANITADMVGTLIFRAAAVDTSGKSTRTSAVVNVTASSGGGGADTTPPPDARMIVNAYEFTEPGTLDITVTASDPSGIAKVEFYDGEQLLATDTTAPYEHKVTFDGADDNGDHTFRAWVVDGAGNPAEAKTIVKVNIRAGEPAPPPPADTTPPTLSFSATPRDVTQAGNVTLSADASDASGVTKVEFYRGNDLLSTDDQAPYQYALPVTHEDNGTLALKARAVDAKGNASEKTTEVSVNVPEPKDTTPPTLNVTSSHTTVTEPTTVTFSAAAQDASGIEEVSLSLQERVLDSSIEAPHVFSQAFTGPGMNGTYEYIVRARDTAGNTTDQKVTVSVQIPESPPPADTTGPVVALSPSQTLFTQPGTLVLSATASDPSGPVRVRFYEGNNALPSNPDDPFKATVNITSASQNGNHVYAVVARDALGNESRTAVEVMVNLTAPPPAFDPAMFEGEWVWTATHLIEGASETWGSTVTSWSEPVTKNGLTTVTGTLEPTCFANTAPPCGGEVILTHDAATGVIRVQIMANVERCGLMPWEGCNVKYGEWLDGNDDDGKVAVENGKAVIKGLAWLDMTENSHENPFELRQK